jgi:hypothetical protein
MALFLRYDANATLSNLQQALERATAITMWSPTQAGSANLYVTSQDGQGAGPLYELSTQTGDAAVVLEQLVNRLTVRCILRRNS